MSIQKLCLTVVVTLTFIAYVAPDLVDNYKGNKAEQEMLRNNMAIQALLQDEKLELSISKALGGEIAVQYAESVNCYFDLVNVIAYDFEWNSGWCRNSYKHIVVRVKG